MKIAPVLRRSASVVLVACGIASIVATGGSTGGTEGASGALPTWAKSFGGPGEDTANGVTRTADGGYLFVGQRNGAGVRRGSAFATGDETADLWVVKLDSFGDRVWERVLSGPSDALAEGVSREYQTVVGAPDGSVWLLGQETQRTELADAQDIVRADAVVTRLDANGNVQWSQVYDSGSYPIGGPTDGDSSNDDDDSIPFVSATRGAVAETILSASPSDDGGLVLAMNLNAEVVVTYVQGSGNASANASASALYVLKIGSDGASQWHQYFQDGALNQWWSGEAIVRAIADDGALLVTTNRSPDGGVRDRGARFVRMGPGSIRWVESLGRLQPLDVVMLDHGDAAIVGRRRSVDFSLEPDAAVVRLVDRGDHGEFESVIEIDEGTDTLAVAPDCEVRDGWHHFDSDLQQEIYRCGVVVLAQKRPDETGALRDGVLAARISPDGDIEKLVSIPGVRSACGLRRLPDALLDGSAAFAGLFASTDDPVGAGVAISLNSELAITPTTASAGMPRCPAADDSRPSDVNMRVTAAGTLLQLSEATSSTGLASATTLTVTRVDGSLAHQREFVSGDGLRIARAMSVAQTDDDADGVADDGYIVAAEIVESISGSNVSSNLPAGLIKLDEQGVIEWQMRYPGVTFSPGGLAALERVVQSHAAGSNAADGFVFVANRPASFDETTSGLGETHLVKTDLLGNPLWVGGALGRANASVRAVAAVARTADGGFIVAGGEPTGAEAEATSHYGWIARVTDSGETLWRTSFPANLGLTSVRETPLGQFIAGGIAGDDPIAVLFDDVGGIVWSQRYPAAGSFAGPVTRIEPVGPNEFIMGTTRRLVTAPGDDAPLSNKGGDLSLLRLHDDGSIVWHIDYGGLQDDVLTSLAVTSDDGVLLGAYSDSVGDRREAWLLRLSPEGNVAPGCNAVLSFNRFQPTPTDTPLHAQSGLSSEGSATPAIPAALAAELSAIGTEETVIARQCSGTTTPPGSAPSEPTFLLRVTQIGTGSGVVSSVPAGIVCGTASGVGCEARFAANSHVSLTLDPLAANHFVGWRDCDAVVGTRCDVQMTSDRAVHADFADSVSMTIASISGQGRVVAEEANIDCRAGAADSICGAFVARGSTLHLTAAPSAGRTFIGWGGACSSSALVLTVPMFESKTCTASFSGSPPGSPFVSVTVAPPDRGRVVSDPVGISCANSSDVCSDQFVRAGAVTLTADAFQAGWEFDRYQCSGVPYDVGSRTVQIPSLTSDVSCIARFSPTIERLYVRILKDLNGAVPPGRVVSDPVSLDCRVDCDRPFMRDQVVTLRALPDPNFGFTAWAGCDRTYPEASAPDVCEVRMGAQRNVVAFFGPERIGADTFRQLAINFAPDSAMGIVTSSPGAIDCSPIDGICSGTFDVTTVVDLALAPFGGSALASNDGCDVFTPAGPGTPAICRVTMNLDRAVTFGFTRTNTPPTAAFTFGPPAPQTGQLIVFDAASSTDDTGIATYRWDYGNNGSFDAAGPVVSRSFALAGDYVVRLQVEDLDGVRDEITHTVTVVPPPPQTALLTMFVSGDGTVASTPAGVECSAAAPCSASFPLGTVVSLVATPNGGATFVGFSGDPDCVDGTVTLAADLTCSADFFASSAQWTQRGGALNVTSSLEAAFAGSPDAYTDGNPVSAFQENGVAIVRRWDGNAWVALGSALGDGSVDIVSVGIDSSGAPVVAWDESDDVLNNGTRNVRAARWNGNAWSVLGGGPVDLQSTDDAHTPTIRARSADIALAWVESDPAGGSRVVVRLWNGTQWSNAGSTAGPAQVEQGAESSGPRLAVGPADELAVAWIEGFLSPNVAELIGGVWTTTPAPMVTPTSGAEPMSDLAYSTTEGLLYVAVQQGGAGGFHVRSWRAGSWTDLGGAHATGRLIFGLAFSHNRTGAMPLLAYGYRDNGLSSVHAYAVERWSGTGWSALGSPIDPIDRHGQPTFEAEVAVVDGAVPVLVTHARGHLPGTGTADHAIVAFGYQ